MNQKTNEHLWPAAGETTDDRQAGRHQFTAEGWDGPLQENDGQTETEQTAVPERKRRNAGGGRNYSEQSDTWTEWDVRSPAHFVSSLLLFSPLPHIESTALACTSVHLLFLCMQLIEDLRRELEHLQLFKLETERPGRTRSSSSGLADFTSRTREMELEHEVKRLKQVPMKGSAQIALLCEPQWTCSKMRRDHKTAFDFKQWEGIWRLLCSFLKSVSCLGS